MKLFCMYILLMSCLSISQPSWHIITIDSEGDEGYYVSLALDNFNHPHISYVRWYNPEGKDLKYAYYDGNVWNISVIDFSLWNSETSIALDSNNAPRISYSGGDSTSTLVKYATLVGSTWQFENVDQYGRFTALAIDSQNHPHITYQQTEVDNFKYAYFNGSSWQLETIDTMYASGQGDNNSITTDSENNPHISYCQDAIGQLRYAHKDDSSWVIEYPDTLQGSTGLGTSICLDSQDRPRISHASPLRYCSKETDTWQVQQIEANGSGGGSLALDSNENPHIAYKSPTEPALKMAHWNGSSWIIETVDTTPYTGSFISLKYDSYDHPHIAYQVGGLSKDLMYAWYGEGSLGVNLQSFTALPAQNGIKLVWQVAASDDTQTVGFNLYRADAGKARKKDWTRLNSSPIAPNQQCQYMDASVQAGQGYQYRLSALTTDGKEEMLGTAQGEAGTTPAAFSLLAVYPNPAKSLLTCRLSLSQPGDVNLSLYDISGRLVLAKRYAVPTGEQDISLGLGKLAKGVYTVQVEAGGAVESKRIVVMR